MNNPNLLGQPEAILAVGSGVLLGGVIVMLILVSLVIFFGVSILITLAKPPEKSKNNLCDINKSKDDQNHCQPLQLSSEDSETARLYNQCVCLLYQCELMLDLLRPVEHIEQSIVSTQLRANPSENFGLLKWLGINFRQLTMKPRNLFSDMRCKLWRKCGIAHKSNGIATPPNEKS